MSRPEEEVQAEIRLNAMLDELEERRDRTGEMPTDEEIFEIRGLQAQAGKSEEEAAIKAYAEETAEILGPVPENPFDQFQTSPRGRRTGNPFEQWAPTQDSIIQEDVPAAPEEFPLSDFPEEYGESRASLQLPSLVEVGTQSFFPERDVYVGIDQDKLDAMGGWEALHEMEQMTGHPVMPPMMTRGLGEVAGDFGMTAAMLTMTDPQEIVDTFTQTVEYEDPNTGEIKETPIFPGISYQVAPDGALILVNNNKKDAKGNPLRALVNRPGFSMLDAMQIVGIGATYTPAGRYSAAAQSASRKAAAEAASETARRLAIRQARKQGAKAGMIGSAITETGLQATHELAGGEFNVGEVAFATGFGVVPDYVFDPLLRTATKIPSYIRGVIPERELAELGGKQAALEYAEQTGRRVMTQDVLQERITPPMAIFAKIVERIPFVGTGRARRRMKQERIDALTELAKKYNIDVTSNYGTEVMESFVRRMNEQRFWGRQQELLESIPHYPLGARRQALERAEQMLERAWVKEMDELSEGALKRAIANDQLDDVVVDQVMNSNRPQHLTELFEKLTPQGQQAAKNRWFLKGLEEATWTPDAPGVASPEKFMAFLDAPKNRKVIEAWFDPAEQQMLKGMREYLRLTAAADKTAAGAGMVAAVGGGGSFIAGLFDAFLGLSAGTAAAGHIYQSAFVRNRLLQLAHTAGDEVATAKIMAQMRPYMIAAQKQWMSDNYVFPEVNITRDSIRGAAEDVAEAGVEMAKEAIGDIGQLPQNIMEYIQEKD